MKSSTLCKLPTPHGVPQTGVGSDIPDYHRHIKRIALGVPEDKVPSQQASARSLTDGIKWDALFEEVGRVLKSGGAFEVRISIHS
jgi:hypothetical protein